MPKQKRVKPPIKPDQHITNIDVQEHPAMRAYADSFRLPKAGNGPEENQDACWPEENLDQEADALHFAVADGATDALFSGIWAGMLVKAYGTGQLNELYEQRLPESFEQLQRDWEEQVEKHLVERHLAGPLSYFYEEKLRDGAFSTLVGLTIRQNSSQTEEGGDWIAVAVGDSCIFQMRDNQCTLAFPLESAEQFTINPHLVPSNERFNKRIVGDLLTKNGQWRTGDEFYLMTDALACWFLLDKEDEIEDEHSSLDEKLKAIRQIQTPDEFEQWITNLRQDRAIRNDDVTLLRIQVK